ncbi:Choline Transporter-Like Protein 5 [Manis pentadactyla]|nr:Choline Transporter-Like Protein 5 [Manis pentadactyla]
MGRSGPASQETDAEREPPCLGFGAITWICIHICICHQDPYAVSMYPKGAPAPSSSLLLKSDLREDVNIPLCA